MKKLNLILAALLFLGAAIARADDIVILENRANDFDTWGMRPDGRERVLNAVSRETGVPIATLEAQRDSTRLGYGGLLIANSLASATGQSFEEIAALKASGHGWGWIAKVNNVKLGPIVSQARHVDNALRNSNGNIEKVKKNKAPKVSDNDGDGFNRGHGNSPGHMKGPKGPKAAGNFHSKGHGKGH